MKLYMKGGSHKHKSAACSTSRVPQYIFANFFSFLDLLLQGLTTQFTVQGHN